MLRVPSSYVKGAQWYACNEPILRERGVRRKEIVASDNLGAERSGGVGAYCR